MEEKKNNISLFQLFKGVLCGHNFNNFFPFKYMTSTYYCGRAVPSLSLPRKLM